MTNYDAGRRFEWAVRDDLRGDGYTVLRTAGSKSKVDLVAFKQGQMLFVQCKRNGLCPPAERAELRRLAALVAAVPVVALKPVRGIGYRQLVGDGPKDWTTWTAEASA